MTFSFEEILKDVLLVRETFLFRNRLTFKGAMVALNGHLRSISLPQCVNPISHLG